MRLWRYMYHVCACLCISDVSNVCVTISMEIGPLSTHPQADLVFLKEPHQYLNPLNLKDYGKIPT